ncbi:hypothetical protein ASO20_02480 [Mycoplasma sp. (ex Biomphalaria glabrata)]|nr:4'-phosphopantetheinyl transferase superfamily protein [Mycoplasma sp. (ex Biomphalaria glabrata)]ALV23501.1 hypothetical protein ASO20_02480 [Mycoplasma sp. (ex Biomphalaria glabrata)]
MMNNFIGIDIVENKRLIISANKIAKRILSQDELCEFTNRKTKLAKREFLAGRWAAKEAIIKCIEQPIPMNKIEIQKTENNKLYFIYNKYNVTISISHEKAYTVAVAYYNAEGK